MISSSVLGICTVYSTFVISLLAKLVDITPGICMTSEYEAPQDKAPVAQLRRTESSLL